MSELRLKSTGTIKLFESDNTSSATTTDEIKAVWDTDKLGDK